MEDFERDLHVARIMSNYTRCPVGNETILVYHGDVDTMYEAQEIYAQTYLKAKEDGCLTEEESIELLIDTGLWDEESENNYQQIYPDHIEYWKVELYQAVFKTEERKKIRKYLKTVRDKYNELCYVRGTYAHMTASGIANSAKHIYLIENSATYLDGTPCDWEKTSLVRTVSTYQQQQLTDDKIRELARTDPWLGIWQVHKIGNSLFPNIVLDSTQRRLVSWSLLYDNLQESSEPPSQTVMNDDDMLDGWLILQSRKREQEEDKMTVEGQVSHNDKIAGASEIYLVAETMKDAKKINKANDARAQATKRKRFDLIKEKGRVKQSEFEDVRLDAAMQQNQAYNDAMKGR